MQADRFAWSEVAKMVASGTAIAEAALVHVSKPGGLLWGLIRPVMKSSGKTEKGSGKGERRPGTTCEHVSLSMLFLQESGSRRAVARTVAGKVTGATGTQAVVYNLIPPPAVECGPMFSCRRMAAEEWHLAEWLAAEEQRQLAARR